MKPIIIIDDDHFPPEAQKAAVLKWYEEFMANKATQHQMHRYKAQLQYRADNPHMPTTPFDEDAQFEDGKEAWNAFELYYHDKELCFWRTMAVAFLIASGMLAITVLILVYLVHRIYETSIVL